MHTIFTDGIWERDYFRDDSDKQEVKDPGIDPKWRGCSYLGYVTSNDRYRGEISFEERLHDESITVEALVLDKENRKLGRGFERNDISFFCQREFAGRDCKNKALNYVKGIKTKIEQEYFSEEVRLYELREKLQAVVH